MARKAKAQPKELTPELRAAIEASMASLRAQMAEEATFPCPRYDQRTIRCCECQVILTSANSLKATSEHCNVCRECGKNDALWAEDEE